MSSNNPGGVVAVAKKTSVFQLLRKKVGSFVVDAPQSIPLITSLIFLSILILVIRMKNIDLDYSYNKLNVEIEKLTVENKDLNAEKADLLSSKNLRKYAEKYNLKEPSEKQIIIIPK